MFNFSASAKCMAMLSRFRRRRLNSIWYRGFVRGAGARKNAQTVAYLLLVKNWKRYHLADEFSIPHTRMPRDKEEHC
jgi:hypothetical protein